MKKTIIKALVISGFMAYQGVNAQALTPVTVGSQVANGDLLLGVNNASGTGNDLLIDLGPFSSLTTGGSLNISADLATAGLSANLYYGVFAVTDGNIVYATTPQLGQIYSNLNAANAGNAQGNYLQPLGVGGANVGTLGYDLANNFQKTTSGGYILSADFNSWTTQNPNVIIGPGFGYTQYNIESPVGSNAYLDRTLTTGTGTQVGTFNLSSGGVLTYNAVPEPSTYALMGLGMLLLVIAYRRKNA